MPPSNPSAHDIHTGTLSAARYLLARRTFEELHIAWDGHLTPEETQDYLKHLANSETWRQYKARLQTDYKATQTGIGSFQDRPFMENPSKAQETALHNRMEAFKTMAGQQKKLESQLKLAQQVDVLIADGELQDWLIAQDELADRYPDHIRLTQAIATNNENIHQLRQHKGELEATLAKATEDEEESLIARLQEVRDQLATLEATQRDSSEALSNLIQTNKDLDTLIKTIERLGLAITTTRIAADDSAVIRKKIEHLADTTEHTTESSKSVDEIVYISLEYADKLIEIGHVTVESLEAVPLAGNFIRGLNNLREAWYAVRDPHTPQRKTKIAAGVFGGLVSIGCGIVGALLVAGTGLMASSAAIAAAPIVIASLIIGVYSVSLYRDSYVLHQARQLLGESRKKSVLLEEDMVRERDAIISTLKEGKDVDEALDNDPRLLRLDLEKTSLDNATRVLEQARNQARKKVAISTISLIGGGLLLGAVCATGIGALITGVCAALVLIGVSMARLYVAYKEKQAHKQGASLAHQSPETVSTGDNPFTHSSEYIINARLSLENPKPATRAVAEKPDNREKAAPVSRVLDAVLHDDDEGAVDSEKVDEDEGEGSQVGIRH